MPSCYNLTAMPGALEDKKKEVYEAFKADLYLILFLFPLLLLGRQYHLKTKHQYCERASGTNVLTEMHFQLWH